MQGKQDNYSNTFKVKHTPRENSEEKRLSLRELQGTMKGEGMQRDVQFGVQFSFYFNRSEAKRDETKRENVVADVETYAGLSTRTRDSHISCSFL